MEASPQRETRQPPQPQELEADTLRGLMHAPTLARLLDIPPRTARRWVAQGIPPNWQRLAAIICHGDLAAMHREWIGWKLDAEALYSPEGWRFSRGELIAIPFEHQRAAALSSEIRRLRRELEGRAQLRLI